MFEDYFASNARSYAFAPKFSSINQSADPRDVPNNKQSIPRKAIEKQMMASCHKGVERHT